MKHLPRTCWKLTVVAVLLAHSLASWAQVSRTFFIGNSYTYTNDLPNTLRLLALSLGDTIMVSSSTPGGATFQSHVASATTVDAINLEHWDFVVLQEQSQLGALPFEITSTEASADQLVELIRSNDPCSMPVFYMTWGRRDGDDLNCASFPFMCTYAGMQQALTANYGALAEEYDAFTAPVGEAWRMVRATHPEIELYVSDGSHPSPAGTYLAASVFYCTLFQESCVPSAYTAGLDPGIASILRDIASEVVIGDPSAWNLDVLPPTDASITGSSSAAWNEVTYYHGGPGEHTWTASNGQSFTSADATFTFPTAGSWIVTHAYTDPCGGTDTVTWTVEVYDVGLVTTDGRPHPQVLASDHGIEVRGIPSGAQLTGFDTQGSLVIEHVAVLPGKVIACPPGILFWLIRTGEGDRFHGRVFVR
ncbi:MAG TPA: hypothetical protein PLL57_11085 [Flavobacteriales bacterium]|nr:hypothetical protein [Flavobacteriales bacterium]